jgi:hypothetical protein
MTLLALLTAALPLTQGSPTLVPAVPLPRGEGLAARYPGDEGLEGDAAVILFESFDAEDVAAVAARWSEAVNPAGDTLALVAGGPEGAAGEHALRITARPGEDTGGHLYALLEREVDTAFARFYVRFPEEGHGYVHHFVTLGGHRPPTRWPQGHAGERPSGDDRFSAGIEPFGANGRIPPPGRWGFYAYWHEMKRSADGRHWGNGLTPAREQRVPVDRWQCVEVMLKLNTPGERDGELALWLDGEPVLHLRAGTPRGDWTGMGFRALEEGGEPFEGFSWRTTAELKLTYLWLMHYVTPEALARNRVEETARPNVVLFDQVVVATEYVGPIAHQGPGDG